MTSCVAPPMLSVRDFIPEVDAAWLHGLWHRSLHGRWTISLGAMLQTLTTSALLLVAECKGLQSGFCAVDMCQGGVAGLTVLLVEPARQHCGVGTELLAKAEAALSEQGVHRLTLGAGHGDYFWPGLPKEQANAWPFFYARGFREEEPSQDLIQDLQHFSTPDWVAGRLAASCSVLCISGPTFRSSILAFERLQFPAWAPYFENEMEQGGYQNILCAQGADGGILGTLLMRHDIPALWTAMDAKQVGTLNTLGVAPKQQGRGIGLALTAGALEILRKRGCSHCLIQWTGLTEWYGKLGATTWAQYRMASKPL